MSDQYMPGKDSDKQWEQQVDAEDQHRQHKIDKLRIAESGSGEYDDEPRKKHRFLHFLGWMLLIVVLTGAGGFAGWYYWLRHVEADKPVVASTPSPAPPATAESPTENYNSLAFQLQFDYPADWKVEETTSNKLTVTSTVVRLKTANGSAVKTVDGKIVMTLQHKQVSLPEFATGDALAARESERIEYAKPSQNQRAATYLSFLSLAEPASKGRKGIDGIYVSGDSGYVKDQIIPQADVVKGDPLISVGFVSCPDTKCATPGAALTLAPSGWDDEKTVKPIRTMLQSIVVQ